MKLKFNTSKIANHFFYISTLTDWGYSFYRAEIKKEWETLLGRLNKEEKSSVLKVFEILTKYQKDNKKWLQNVFYFLSNEKQIWSWIKDNYTKEEYQILKQAFKVTSQKFGILWKRVEIDKVNRFFEQLNDDYFQGMFNRVKGFFKFKDDSIVNIAILPIGLERGIAGHSWGNKKMIVNVEFSMDEIKRNNIRDMALLLAHEIFHSIFKKTKCLKIFEEEITKNKIDRVLDKSLILSEFYGRSCTLVDEAITSTFCNRYYLEALYGRPLSLLDRVSLIVDGKNKVVLKNFIMKGKKVSRDLVLMYIGYRMFPLVLHYIYENKAIDRKIIQLFIEEVKEILRWENIK